MIEQSFIFSQIKKILKNIKVTIKNISDGGYLALGTFSINGPKKCRVRCFTVFGTIIK